MGNDPACTQHLPGLEVQWMEGLLVDGCQELGATAILRGVRTAADLDYERQMALSNRAMRPEVETVLLISAPEHAHISSTLVRPNRKHGRGCGALCAPLCSRLSKPVPSRSDQ